MGGGIYPKMNNYLKTSYSLSLQLPTYKGVGFWENLLLLLLILDFPIFLSYNPKYLWPVRLARSFETLLSQEINLLSSFAREYQIFGPNQ